MIESIMMHLTNKTFKDNILTDIMELSNADLKFVTKDGTCSTHKLLLWSAFPALHDCLLECFQCGEEVTVILPEESVDKVQEGIVKMLLEGDISFLERSFGIKSSDLNHNKNNDVPKTKKSDVEPRIIRIAYESDYYCNEIAEDIGQDPLEQEVCVNEEQNLQDEENEEHIPTPKKRLKKIPNTTCDECGKKFRDRSNLNRHIKSGHKTIKCERCDEELQGREVYNVHLKTCWLRCEMCDWVTKFKTGERMNGHKRRHAKEGEKCTFLSQKLEEEEIEALKKRYNEKWKNREKEYTERITYVYKYRKDNIDNDSDS